MKKFDDGKKIFTGLIEEQGKIIEIAQSGQNSLKIKIAAQKVLNKVAKGDSIATNGVCLTVIEFSDSYFVADAMPETFRRSNLSKLKSGDSVNLEKSITLSTPLGGHIVTGDVDCTGTIESINSEGIAKLYTISLDEQRYAKYIVEKGRISLDGASLTVVACDKRSFVVSLIPHTQASISLGEKKVGDMINIETDLIGKYIERFMMFADEGKKNSNIDMAFLMKNGFA